MKIQGPNHSNFNPYQKQINKQAEIKSQLTKREDQLHISDKAKALQDIDKPSFVRQKKVAQIKQAVQSGEYTVDAKETAKKMLDFWNNKI
ncbi:flagellar biosynthesis anti-sigma factor FlgM [Aquibacillus kalidii]|uniref:flagellar biosynthesis anti-sigma factor FlgM n=1 Tax=Aquibacillus kalidii TaxID=2762597 RepID=UPI001647790C|nr:flagellar biosynthesis anti-sigma factor FlgM [Aquibacillus kalidii]